ncbi:DUF4270 family protein [Hymenobacter negativus]|uniref:DUF4270 family protein n=1 Tax=Hymenobacter negativus TaxID=2795026 RepID=A0ABS3QDK4_9BACT|nr:DUF4270 family protein [Hymenobacter negativus]MBO2009326.1 DUF4270 family protein [Hymenobacter negativus]
MWTKPAWGARLAQWLKVSLLVAAVTACDPAGNITIDVPQVSPSGSGYYVDTLTVRLATVWHDSVATSASDDLLVGRYHDPRLGTITARSYFRVGLAAAYAPGSTEVFDSLVLELKPDAYRYGDTTRQQTVEVHRLRDQFEDAKTYYAFNQLSYDATVLNQGTSARPIYARPSLRTLRLRLADALGRELLSGGQAGRLTTEAEVNYLLAGLVLTPGANDDAALLRTQVSAEGGALHLYTHDPAAPLSAIAQEFTLAAGTKHFYQVTADRTGTLLTPLTTPLQSLDVAQTAQEAYIDGVLGLQTKVEIPYLTDLRTFGSTLTIVQAYLTAEVVPGSSTRYLGPPTNLAVYLSGRGNQQGLALGSSTTGTVVSVPFQSGTSALTGLETGRYSLSVTEYCQAVANRTLDNNGLLLASATPTAPERVVLGGPRRSENRLKLTLYFMNK